MIGQAQDLAAAFIAVVPAQEFLFRSAFRIQSEYGPQKFSQVLILQTLPVAGVERVRVPGAEFPGFAGAKIAAEIETLTCGLEAGEIEGFTAALRSYRVGLRIQQLPMEDLPGTVQQSKSPVAVKQDVFLVQSGKTPEILDLKRD